jgi:hypothetical protein
MTVVTGAIGLVVTAPLLVMTVAVIVTVLLDLSFAPTGLPVCVAATVAGAPVFSQ